jgi:hypothetical protein
MKTFISLGLLSFEYPAIVFAYIFIISYGMLVWNTCDNFNQTLLLDFLLNYAGNLLCFIPLLFVNDRPNIDNSDINSKLAKTNYGIIKYLYNDPQKLKKKDIVFIIIISLLKLFVDFLDHFEDIIIRNYEVYLKNELFFVEIVLWFFFSKYVLKMPYYRHQYVSVIGVMILRAIKLAHMIFISVKPKNIIYEVYILLLELLSIVIESICFGYLKGLMEYKFWSPYKCCFIVGIINTPIVLIIYFIVTYIPCHSEFLCGENEHYDNIIEAFSNLEPKEYFLLILYSISFGIHGVLNNRIIHKFTFYHLLIPTQLYYFIDSIIEKFPDNDEEKDKDNTFDLVFEIFFFLAELLMYCIFIEIIELNFCGLNRNVKKKIQERAIIDYSLDEGSEDSFFEGMGDDDDKKLFDIDEIEPCELNSTTN